MPCVKEKNKKGVMGLLVKKWSSQCKGTGLLLTGWDSRSKQHFASTVFLKREKLAQQLLAAVRELILNYPKGRSLLWDDCTSPYSG